MGSIDNRPPIEKLYSLFDVILVDVHMALKGFSAGDSRQDSPVPPKEARKGVVCPIPGREVDSFNGFANQQEDAAFARQTAEATDSESDGDEEVDPALRVSSETVKQVYFLMKRGRLGIVLCR